MFFKNSCYKIFDLKVKLKRIPVHVLKYFKKTKKKYFIYSSVIRWIVSKKLIYDFKTELFKTI